MARPVDEWIRVFPGWTDAEYDLAHRLPVITPRLVSQIADTLRDNGFRMPTKYADSLEASTRYLRAVAGVVNAFTGADPFEGVAAPSVVQPPASPLAVRVVHTVTLLELQQDRLPRIPDGAHVRFELGADVPISYPVPHNATWCALGAASVEFVGSGPNVARLARLVEQRCAQEKAQQPLNVAANERTTSSS
ncbi:hypothetical protein ACVDFE_02235 [Lentzea chajnantorensis]